MEHYVKLALALILLIHASILDWRYREIRDSSWLALVALGVVFTLLESISTGSASPAVSLLISLAVTAALTLPLAYFGLMGGGDAVILIGIAAVFPEPPPGVVSLFPVFSLSVFTNAILLSLLLPIYFFLRNLPHLRRVRSPAELYALFLGYRKPASAIKPYEAVYGSGGEFRFLLRTDAELGKAEGEGEVWVTPAVPFVIPITIAFLLSALCGDVVSALILFLRGS
ncbi:MAG: hypothetical protein GXO66_03990 [Euryarchaeota archaeon]|nr:hypothetical protein [Euryarchaeota archaeon]